MPPAARGRPLAPPARGESRCVRCPQGSQARPRGTALPPFGSNFPRTASGRAHPSLAEGPLPPQDVREDAEMFFNNKLLSVKDNFFANTGRKERLPAGIFPLFRFRFFSWPGAPLAASPVPEKPRETSFRAARLQSILLPVSLTRATNSRRASSRPVEHFGRERGGVWGGGQRGGVPPF